MKNSTILPLFLSLLILVSACTSTAVIRSVPTGADLYINENYVGNTPYMHSDNKITGTNNIVRLEMPGYKTTYGTFKRNGQLDTGALIGGLFFWPVFLWIMAYEDSYTFQMTAGTDDTVHEHLDSIPLSPQNKEARLKELKELYDKGLITQEEYDQARKKVLEIE